MITKEYITQLNGKNRFFIASYSDSYKMGLQSESPWLGDEYYYVFERTENGIIYHGNDQMEPEDASFARDLWWVIELLNKKAQQQKKE